MNDLIKMGDGAINTVLSWLRTKSKKAFFGIITLVTLAHVVLTEGLTAGIFPQSDWILKILDYVTYGLAALVTVAQPSNSTGNNSPPQS